MTDFIRNILVTAAANANANSAANANANSSSSPSTDELKMELSKPVNQIQIPASVMATTTPTTSTLAVEKQRMIKVEVTDTPSSTDAGKAQRAARRDVVNARRNKRKAMAASASSSCLPASPLGHTSGCSSSDSDSDDDVDDKSKKMKTGKTSSVAVVGGLGVSGSDKPQRPSISSTMPPTPGLLFTPEIDAAGEERLRAMEAQLETLDPDSKEAKKKRRLIRNRMSAQLHRERKKAYVGQLEDQLLEKDRELKLLQEKLAKLMEETEKAKQQSPTETAAPVEPAVVSPSTKPTVAPIQVLDEEIMIKEEPQTWDSPWAMDSAESWDLAGLEATELNSTADLLRDFDDPFAGLGSTEYADLCKPHHEIHAAKKNIAMMAAVMFSVSFFGNSPSFYNVAPGSNFSSMFGAQTAKDLSQMSIASRIVACLEKTSWKEFRDVSTWLSAQTEEQEQPTTDESTAAAAVASPSAASDVTDMSCSSPIDDALDVAMETDLLDQFEYPVDETMTGDWLKTEAPKTAEPQQQHQQPASLTSRLYEKLTTLWREKSQVLLTVRDDKQQVLQRSLADMSSIREGLESGNLFASVLGGGASDVEPTQDQSVTFLYPMSAFASEAKTPQAVVASGDGAADPVFLEVSCQLNGGVATAMM